MKKFSIVVPVYNVEAYLDDCLRSLQGQTYGDYEVVCVNDGSTDGSRALLGQWAARYPQMRIVDRENGGLSAARNSGTEVAEGEYIVYVDSDDWVSPDMLEKLAAAADGADMVCYACQRTDNEQKDTLAAETSTGWDYYRRHALEARVVPFVCVWQRAYRREFLNANRLRFREGILHEDNQFTPRACLRAARVRVIPDTLYYYRVREGSIMTTRGLRSKESFVLIGNELSDLFAQEESIDKTTVYQALTHIYQMAFADNTREEDRHLLHLLDWRAYRRASRTKARHRRNYLAMRLSPALYRFINKH
ncbi:MAG: glycosyltransferase [Bacteroidales bacterium]|nr:glycosyltransferase [Bacteroidales bacterium]